MYDYRRQGRNGGALTHPTAARRQRTCRTSSAQQDTCNEGNAFIGQRFCRFLPVQGPETDPQRKRVDIDETRGTEVSQPPVLRTVRRIGRRRFRSSHSREIAYNMQQLLTYTNTFADVHNLDLLFGHEMYNQQILRPVAAPKTMTVLAVTTTELSGAVVDASRSGPLGSGVQQRGLLLPRTVRLRQPHLFLADRTAATHRRASTPTTAGATSGRSAQPGSSTSENWFNASWVNMLKLKASYGSQGNDNIGSKLPLLPLHRLLRDPEQQQRRNRRALRAERQSRHHRGRPTPT